MEGIAICEEEEGRRSSSDSIRDVGCWPLQDVLLSVAGTKTKIDSTFDCVKNHKIRVRQEPGTERGATMVACKGFEL